MMGSMCPTRTNSLGWAKSDCHTCQATSQYCNRRRPRCDACTDQGIICGGYVQKLQWKDHVPPQRRKTRRNKQCRTQADQSRQASAVTTELTIVQENGRGSKTHVRMGKSSRSIQEGDAEPNPRQSQCVMNTGYITVPVLFKHEPEIIQLSSSSLEQLAFFAWKFSPVTLTYSITANPWQACLPQIEKAPFLLNAVRALAIRHRSHLEEVPESLSVLELKDFAISSFAQSIHTVSLEVGISVSLILIGIDYAESAFGNWTIHLRGVYKMIESTGGIQRAARDMHIRAQIALLVWFDTIIALLSRRELVFPRNYAECIVSWQNDSQWSLLALNGYPDAAFLDMYNVAEAASQASSLSDGQASSLEMKLWLAHFETEQGATDRDMAALTECWRLGLVLYCTRVFHQGEDVKGKAYMLAEEIMWLIHELPPDSHKQKQAVLPLFLAACEMESFRFRRIAIEFCERWKKKSGIWLSQTALELLQAVWTAVDENPHRDIWWGDLIVPEQDFGYLFG